MSYAANEGASGRAWSNFAADFDLPEKEAHVWLASLADAGISLDPLADCLSLAERERAARFKFLPDKTHYLIAHVALRSILGMYLNVHPDKIEFSSGPVGKPQLAQKFLGSEIKFNLSHSGEIALIAITRAIEVGIDVERIQEDFAFESIAQRFFTSREVAALQDLPPDLRREAFYKCWTSKEALIKGKGLGLSGSLDEVQIRLTATGVLVIAALADWALAELSPISGYAAALAINQIDGESRCYRWEPSLPVSTHRP